LTQYIDINKNTKQVIEIGSGAGAFIDILKKNHPHIKISGVDYCENLISIANNRLDGDFIVGNACNLYSLKNQMYDVVLSFGMTAYLDSIDDCRKFINEAFRIAKPNGTIYIGEVSDLAKKDFALNLRKKTHTKNDLDHLYIKKFIL
jgi:ubiquinone/menaquinone biosynthesis C-methylase UbiE